MTKKRTSKPRTVDVATAKVAPAVEKPGKMVRAENLRFSWPFDRKNLIWFLGAIAVIIIGYVFLGHGPYDSVSSMTIGPILLVIGYLILVPVSILVRSKK
ncbi:MAG TPA: hypothetical protein ENH10_06535 [Bacteroidetes bacterium]|nr:hypothetical protein BMS3Bbin04_01889 [bacterium BMS3Bbin04]HDO65675.1 hypothetical protein [Bacteroidota bacterium]HEX04800.1 hypothetical protein [Bacteroidota bacterium]